MAKYSDYLKLHNQGNIVSNIRLLHEMDLAKADYADKYGYYAKKDVARIGINSLIITTGSKVGEEAIAKVDEEGDEGLNSPLQNAKERMLILRVLGFVSADYDSEVYSITPMGQLMIKQFRRPTPDFRLLLEAFLNITTSTECYDHQCSPSFKCYLGIETCYALACLDYRLSTDEMPLITTCDLSDIDNFIKDLKSYRERNERITGQNPHFPKTKRGTPVKQASNLTRSINQILRVTGIINRSAVSIGNRKYYTCTDNGKKFVDNIKDSFHRLTFKSAYDFRKMNNISEQSDLCNKTYNAMLKRSGIDTSLEDCDVMFSPFQMLPETSAQWFLNQELRHSPESEQARIRVINSRVTARDLRLKAFYQEVSDYDENETGTMRQVREDIDKLKTEGKSIGDAAGIISEKYKDTDKSVFYPFIHALLSIIGLNCKGEVGRYDAYCTYKGFPIPVEIKSFTETKSYNAKGIRQAIENKITVYDGNKGGGLKYASMVVGYSHPDIDTQTRLLIEEAYSIFSIKIIATDTPTLVRMAIRRLWENEIPDYDKLLTDYGILND